MKVFVSWSGEPSRSIARVLAAWLEEVLPQVDAWMSDKEIESGARWPRELADSLEGTNYGILCVTRENQNAPWLAFEAGALAKSVSIAKVVPLCMDLPTSDLTGPLKEFQGRCLDEPDVKRLVQDLNKAAEKQLGNERLDRIFHRWWPDLETAIDQALKGGQLPPQKPEREPVDMLAELIDILRRMERTGQWLPMNTHVVPPERASNETPAARKSPITTVSNIPGSRIHTSNGPVDSPEEPSKAEV